MSRSLADSINEQSINPEQMMSEIEDIVLDLVSHTQSEFVEIKLPFEHFRQELKDCFTKHFGGK